MTADIETDPTIIRRVLTGIRPNSLAQAAPHGGYVEWPAESRPWIMPNHIDGPLLHFRNGELHWLTLWERLRVWLGLDTAESLERKHKPWLQEPPCDVPLCPQAPIIFLNGQRMLCWEHYCETNR